MIAGQDATFSNNLDDVYRYDIALDQWTQLNPFPGGGRGYGYGVYDENDAYLGFGSNNNGFPTDWWHFDMSMNSGHSFLHSLMEEIILR